MFAVAQSHPARNCPLRRGRTFRGVHHAASSPFHARQIRANNKIDQRVHAIAADPRSSEAMDPRSSEAFNASHERAKAKNASINQRLWKERLGHRGTSSVVSREEALGTYQWAPGSGYKG